MTSMLPEPDTDAMPLLNPADRVEPAPGPRVPPQMIPPPDIMTVNYPGVHLSPEAVEANVGRTMKINYGEGAEKTFLYEAEITSIEPAPDGSGMLVTLKRL